MLHFLSFLLLISTTSSATTVTIPLSLSTSTTTKTTQSLDILQQLTHLASTSLTRAKHIKHPKTKIFTTTTPLFSQSYGAYTISLKFGTPPQKLQFIFDTGSSLVWFPCTPRYVCNHCSTSGTPKIINGTSKFFIPRSSTTSKLIGCQNPKCGWVHENPKCEKCGKTTTPAECSPEICPPYTAFYGSGLTGGVLLSETLVLDDGGGRTDFAVGCSLFSAKTPIGIAGFGRRPLSLVSQLGVTKFSYCLLSHRFDDSSQSTELLLESNLINADSNGVKYTKILPSVSNGSNPIFENYYYVAIRKVTVGNERVKIPNGYLSRGLDGSGGSIVDSGTTFTFMESRVFQLVSRELERQVPARYRNGKAKEMEGKTGLRPCFDVSGEKNGNMWGIPKLGVKFKGGVDLYLPLENYFSYIEDTGVVCMTIVTDNGGGSGGPAVILGNFQLQNYYIEFDVKNERLGFRQQTCK